MHILDQKEAIWNSLFSMFELWRGPPNVAGPGKTFPLPHLDGSENITGKGTDRVQASLRQTAVLNFMQSSHCTTITDRSNKVVQNDSSQM